MVSIANNDDPCDEELMLPRPRSSSGRVVIDKSEGVTIELSALTVGNATATRSRFAACKTLLTRSEDEKRYAHNLGLDATREWLAYLITPTLAIGVLVTALVLGGVHRQMARAGTQVVFGIGIDEDLQIAMLGLVNKLVDLLVLFSLEKMALLYATVWMVQPDVGATVQDVEQLKGELAKPWVALNALRKRRGGGVVRFLLCFPVSVCVLFLGLGMNTLAWPKKRWFPDGGMTVYAPAVGVDRVDWAEDMRLALEMVGGTPTLDEAGKPVMHAGAADELAGGFSAGAVLAAIRGLPFAYTRQPRDWFPVADSPAALTGIYTAAGGGGGGDDGATQSISVQTSQIMDLFRSQQATGPSVARGAIGLTGHIMLTIPMLTTTCFPFTTKNATTATENSLTILPPSANSSATFTIHLGPSSGLSFPGTACTVAVSQVLFPVQTWIVDNATTAYAQIHDISAPASPVPFSSPSSSSSNEKVAALLATHAAAILPNLHGTVPSFGIVPHLLLTARQLHLPSSSSSPTAGLAPVIAILLQHQLTTATWTTTTNASQTQTMVPSSPVRWQIYGSGPRLAWEWAAAAFPAIVALSMLELIRLVLTRRIAVGRFLSMGGLLRAANATAEMRGVRRARELGAEAEERMDATVKVAVVAGEGEGVGENQRFLLQEVGSSSCSLSSSSEERLLKKKKKKKKKGAAGEV
ncbi:hypothetical protein B0T22DRAFT_286114 [Podospora appendiculata]|uniref:Transmembrane protein n=1 Tax=Podospora appendiculata TaxID=314037 RepID=A0AAE0X1J0_9PEZI|nr:hypothetical protein B0T22DRAFT_286114 [Podospora appendiculata]